MVITLIAVITSIDTMLGANDVSPERDRRITVASKTRMESGKATKASWWVVNFTPCFTHQPVGEMSSANRGPTVCSRCQSPQ